MKRQNLSKMILLFCLILTTFQIFAQEKLQALKFDEFEISADNQFYTYQDEISISQRTERLIKQLKNERAGAKVYLIYYQARITNDSKKRDIENQIINNIESAIRSKSRLQYDDVVAIDGGYREETTFEFWIAPKNAEPPAPTPTFVKSETFLCPDIFISIDTPPNQNESLTFSISSYQLKELNNYSLTWKVSPGEIVSGQGTNAITVKLKDSGLKRVTAFVEVGGLPYPCRKIFSAMGEFRGKLHLIDSFGPITTGDLRARLDNFLIELQNNAMAKGYIIVYGNRTEGNKSIERRMTIINNHFRLRGFDVSRIIVIGGGFREYLSSEIWLSFDDVVKPIPTPSVDKRFVEVSKQPRKPSRRN